MITLSKLAKLAHVSVSTVSKAFSMSSEVNEQTREAIFSLAREHGCFKKYYNAKYPKFVVAVICPEFRGRYYAQCMSVIQEQLNKYNIELCVATTDFSLENEIQLFEYYNNYSNVDAIISVNGRIDPGQYELPAVSINPSSYCDNINFNNTLNIEQSKAFKDIINFFLERGVTKIGYIGEMHTTTKQKLFKEYLEQLGQNYDEKFFVTTEKRFEEGGYDGLLRLIEAGNVPRAIVCAYDYMAIGCIRCAIDHGFRVPEDIAVVGMNNIPECEYLNPPLATIDSNTTQICKNAVELVVSMLNGTEPNLETLNESKFIIRKSAEI